jgi:hypothetical protein
VWAAKGEDRARVGSQRRLDKTSVAPLKERQHPPRAKVESEVAQFEARRQTSHQSPPGDVVAVSRGGSTRTLRRALAGFVYPAQPEGWMPLLPD